MSASWRANTETLTASCRKLSNDNKPQSSSSRSRARIGIVLISTSPYFLILGL